MVHDRRLACSSNRPAVFVQLSPRALRVGAAHYCFFASGGLIRAISSGVNFELAIGPGS